MRGDTWYSWQCPVCGAISERIIRRRSRCRKYGLIHLSDFHKKTDLEPLIKIVKSDGKTISKIGKPSNVWIEISEPFLPGIKDTDLLQIPNHIFIKKSVYMEIMKKIQGRK